MQFKLAFISAALATLAVATPARRGESEPASSCTTGPIQCCQSVEPASSSAAAVILAGLGIVLQDLSVLVGLTCTDVAGAGCSANAVCCENNQNNDLIAIGCVPVTL
ncbi:hydrophobin 2 [Lentinula aciculospora]|uniref:Hydrophobin n=1 Tax=Lentinula aciculospora TaxID=153920 RepID=A0A9W8ZU59_9AGAR|nr:hydrophobin 2 [Lentinula aciculospora]KAJ4467057.1 hydrophobin 2 [Lentinula aciculospora]